MNGSLSAVFEYLVGADRTVARRMVAMITIKGHHLEGLSDLACRRPQSTIERGRYSRFHFGRMAVRVMMSAVTSAMAATGLGPILPCGGIFWQVGIHAEPDGTAGRFLQEYPNKVLGRHGGRA